MGTISGSNAMTEHAYEVRLYGEEEVRDGVFWLVVTDMRTGTPTPTAMYMRMVGVTWTLEGVGWASARTALLEQFAPLVSIGAASMEEAHAIAAKWAWTGQWAYEEKLRDAHAVSLEFSRPMSLLAMQLE